MTGFQWLPDRNLLLAGGNDTSYVFNAQLNKDDATSLVLGGLVPHTISIETMITLTKEVYHIAFTKIRRHYLQDHQQLASLYCYKCRTIFDFRLYQHQPGCK